MFILRSSRLLFSSRRLVHCTALHCTALRWKEQEFTQEDDNNVKEEALTWSSSSSSSSFLALGQENKTQNGVTPPLLLLPRAFQTTSVQLLRQTGQIGSRPTDKYLFAVKGWPAAGQRRVAAKRKRFENCLFTLYPKEAAALSALGAQIPPPPTPTLSSSFE